MGDVAVPMFGFVVCGALVLVELGAVVDVVPECAG